MLVLYFMITPNYNLLKKYFSKSRKVVITTHRSPDGDALGSSIALYDRLKVHGHEVKVIVPNSYPNYLKFMPFIDDVLIYEDDEVKCIEIIKWRLCLNPMNVFG